MSETEKDDERIYELLVETKARLEAHIDSEEKTWKQFRRHLDNHEAAISKLQQTVNNGIKEKVTQVHGDMEQIKRNMPDKISREDMKRTSDQSHDFWSRIFAAVAALASLGVLLSQVL